MTAELTDERLAELVEHAAENDRDWERASGGRLGYFVDVELALRELQAYRAKRETHVWVPKAHAEALDRLQKRVKGLLAASDGNPP